MTQTQMAEVAGVDRSLWKAAHVHQLKRPGFITLNIDWAQNGVGSAACGPKLQDKYVLTPRPFKLKFRMKEV